MPTKALKLSLIASCQARWITARPVSLGRLALVPLLLLGAASPASAQVPQGTYVSSITKTSQTAVRWFNTNCIRLRPNANGSADIDDGSEIEAIRRAVDNWHRAVADCSYLRMAVLPPMPNAEAGFVGDGPNENVIVWVASEWETSASPERDPSAAAITTLSFVDKPGSSQDGRILDADIEVNGEFFSFATNGAAGRTDVENTITHELGHLMGLDHPCDDGQRDPVPPDGDGNAIPSCFPRSSVPAEMRELTMFNFAERGETLKRTPEGGDIRGICETYPTADDPGRCVDVDLSSGGCRLVSLSLAERSARLCLALTLAFVLLSLSRRRSSSVTKGPI